MRRITALIIAAVLSFTLFAQTITATGFFNDRSSIEDHSVGVLTAAEEAMRTYYTGAHEHDGVAFEAWSDTTNLPTTAGNYYLTADVRLDETWGTPEGEASLCLNGHKITYSSYEEWESSVIFINVDSLLDIYDCSEDESGIIANYVDLFTKGINTAMGYPQYSVDLFSTDGYIYRYDLDAVSGYDHIVRWPD